MRRRKLLGGPAPEAISREVAVYRARLADDAGQLEAQTMQIGRARDELEAAIDAFIG